MPKRVTFLISDKNLIEARKIQKNKMIPENDFTVSFSNVLNMLIEEGLEKKYD